MTIETSRQRQIEALGVGESLSTAKRFDLDHLHQLPDVVARLRRSLDSQAHRARATHPDRQWKVEVGSFLTQSNSAVAVVALITRTA